MPKLVDATAQRAEIRRAARRVFARRGVKGTGLVQVAREARMGRSSLYHYYPDKSSLVRALTRELLDEEEAIFRQILDGAGSPIERIERLISALIPVFDTWYAEAVLTLDLHSLRSSHFRGFFRRVRALLAATIAAGQADGSVDRALNPELAAALIIGTIDGLLLQYLADRGAFEDGDALEAALLRAVRKGLT